MSQNRSKVLIVYPFLPHYRYGIFDNLQSSNRYTFSFAAAEDGFDGIQTIDPSLIRGFYKLGNVRFGPFLWQRGLIRLVLGRKYDSFIFLGDVTYLSTWIGAAYARLSGRTVYFWTIGWHRPERGLRRVLRLYFYRLANRLMLYGAAGKQIGQRMGYPTSRMSIIANSYASSLSTMTDSAIEDLERNSVAHLADITGDCVGAVIRLSTAKNLHLLIDAVALINSQGQRITIVLAGHGSDEETLRNRARERGVTLLLLGAIYSNQALMTIYSRIIVTVVPTSIGLTAIQSLSFGTPAISDNDSYTQMPEWEAIIPDKTGQLYQSGDVSDLARCIKKQIADCKIRHDQIAEDCKNEVAANWTPSNQYGRIIEVLNRSDPEHAL